MLLLQLISIGALFLTEKILLFISLTMYSTLIPDSLYKPCPLSNTNISYLKIKVIIIIVSLLNVLLVTDIFFSFILEDVNALISVTNRTRRKKKNSNGVEDLNQSKKLDLMDIYRTPEPKIAESTFFSSTPWSLTKRLHVGP